MTAGDAAADTAAAGNADTAAVGNADTDAATAAAFVLQASRRVHGKRWDQGSRAHAVATRTTDEALLLFARRRVRGVSEPVVSALLGWAAGQRPAVLGRVVPTAREVLDLQTRGARFVSLVPDAAAAAHGDPRHLDGLAFALHDLCHLEKFADPAHHRGQVGFFRCVADALDSPAWCAVEAAFDDQWAADRDYVIADMNGSAIFLFAALKMKLNMAVRRQVARVRGVAPPTTGPLTPDERAAYAPALEVLLLALGLPTDARAAGHLVSARRDDPAAAARLLAAFEARGY